MIFIAYVMMAIAIFSIAFGIYSISYLKKNKTNAE
jgi:hypothetical protein